MVRVLSDNMEFRIIEDNEELIEDLIDYYKIDAKELLLRLSIGGMAVKDDWEKKEINKSFDDFYKKCKNYIYDLSYWHLGERRYSDYEIVEAINMRKCNTVIDYGCGMGENGILISKYLGIDVTIVDLPCPSLEFAKFRIKKHNYNIKVFEIGIDDEKFINKKYDCITCFDVLEHLDDDTYRIVIDRLKQMKDNHVIISTSNVDSNHPMHFKQSQWRKDLLQELMKSKDL